MTRLFNLDFQLVHDTVLLAISVFFLFLIMSHLLFNPARDFLEKRRKKIADQLKNAEDSEKDAQALKAEYEAKLKNADKEAETILTEARAKAKKNGERIISEASEEASRIIARAKDEAALEEKRAEDDIKQEIIRVACAMAGKIVSVNMNEDTENRLLDETLSEIGEKTWQD